MKNKRLLAVVAIIIPVILCFIIYGIYCDNTIKTTEYSIENNKSDANLHFVMISDLHNKEYGADNENLLTLIRNENPDFIAVCGDMMVKWNSDTEPMKKALSNISCIAPTYVVLGNHDLVHIDKIDFEKEISETGAILLDNESVKIETEGGRVLLGGLSDYPYYDYDYPDYDNPERYFWEDFCEESRDYFSILLHHQPEYISTKLSGSNVDLVLCGHTHGGQIQLPFVGGVFSPNQGFFPKYDKGEFSISNTTMIVSSGLGNNVPIPRFNNQPEICVIDIK